MISQLEIDLLAEHNFKDKDDRGVTYSKTVNYMPDSVRISLKTVMRLRSRTKAAESIYWAILTEMPNNKYEVAIDRNSLKRLTKLSDASISIGLKDLTNLTSAEEEENKRIENDNSIPKEEKDKYKYHPLVTVNKNIYRISVAQCYKGNVDKMIRKEKELREELIMIEREKIEHEKIHELSFKLRNKK